MGAMMRRWSAQTRNTLRHNTASIMKDLICCIDKITLMKFFTAFLIIPVILLTPSIQQNTCFYDGNNRDYFPPLIQCFYPDFSDHWSNG